MSLNPSESYVSGFSPSRIQDRYGDQDRKNQTRHGRIEWRGARGVPDAGPTRAYGAIDAAFRPTAFRPSLAAVVVVAVKVSWRAGFHDTAGTAITAGAIYAAPVPTTDRSTDTATRQIGTEVVARIAGLVGIRFWVGEYTRGQSLVEIYGGAVILSKTKVWEDDEEESEVKWGIHF